MEKLERFLTKQEAKQVLLDKSNSVPIALSALNGDRKIWFTQVFSMEYKGSVYCILKPVIKVEGACDGCFVFKMNNKTGGLNLVKEKNVSDAIIEKYISCFDKED